MNIDDLVIGEEYPLNDVREAFQNKSFMRGINMCKKTKCLVLLCSLDGTSYDDAWKDGILHYTGEGEDYDQTYQRGNKTLGESRKNHLPVHLFLRKAKNGNYTYYGEVVLSGDHYITREANKKGKFHLVYKFPLRLLNE